MSTLEVVCSRCDKKFRVRAEFAGRSTRCPGCSAPITIGGAPKAAEVRSRPAEEERPRPRPRRRDDDDDEPRRASENWKPVDQALRREQLALIFALLSILAGIAMSCLGAMARGPGMMGEGVMIVSLFCGVGPLLATAAFGLLARVSALGAPKESLARGSAVASLLCSIAGIVALVALAFSVMMSIDAQRRDELPLLISAGVLVVSSLGSLFTFMGFTVQVGIARRSSSVSRGVARTGIAIAICILSIVGIAILYAFYDAVAPSPPPPAYRDAYGGSRSSYTPPPDHSNFYRLVVFILFPVSFAVVMVLYHRLLAAGRRAVTGEVPSQSD